MTHPHPESVETVQPFGITPSPRTGRARMVAFCTAAVSLVGAIWLPYGLLSLAHGMWLGPRGSSVEPVLLGALIGLELFVELLGCTSGIAAGAGKIWSRFGIMLYAILSLVLAVVAIWPFVHYVPATADADVGIRHAMIMLCVVKQWVIETPLAIAILYTYTRTPIERAFANPVIQSPDRSQR